MKSRLLLLLVACAVGLGACAEGPEPSPSNSDSTQHGPPTNLTNVQELDTKDGYVGSFGCFGTTGIYWLRDKPLTVIPRDEHCPAQ